MKLPILLNYWMENNMIKQIIALPLIERVSALKDNLYVPVYLPLPGNYDRIFALVDDYWHEVEALICYDKFGVPNLAIKRSDKNDLQYGVSVNGDTKKDQN